MSRVLGRRKKCGGRGGFLNKMNKMGVSGRVIVFEVFDGARVRVAGLSRCRGASKTSRPSKVNAILIHGHALQPRIDTRQPAARQSDSPGAWDIRQMQLPWSFWFVSPWRDTGGCDGGWVTKNGFYFREFYGRDGMGVATGVLPPCIRFGAIGCRWGAGRGRIRCGEHGGGRGFGRRRRRGG